MNRQPIGTTLLVSVSSRFMLYLPTENSKTPSLLITDNLPPSEHLETAGGCGKRVRREVPGRRELFKKREEERESQQLKAKLIVGSPAVPAQKSHRTHLPRGLCAGPLHLPQPVTPSGVRAQRHPRPRPYTPGHSWQMCSQI